MQSSYCIKELAELPAGIFENTGVKTFLLHITTECTDKAVIKRYAADTDNIKRYGLNHLIAADDITVSEDEFKSMEDWNIERIFELQDEDWIEFQKSSVKKAELGEAAVIFRGKAVNKKIRMAISALLIYQILEIMRLIICHLIILRKKREKLILIY